MKKALAALVASSFLMTGIAMAATTAKPTPKAHTMTKAMTKAKTTPKPHTMTKAMTKAKATPKPKPKPKPSHKP